VLKVMNRFLIAGVVEYLGSSLDIAPEVFNLIWSYKDELPLLDLLRPMNKYSFYECVGDQGLETMVQVLKYAKKDKKLINELVNYWFSIAYAKLNTKVSFSIEFIVTIELLYPKVIV
jgi:hypothetical protein